MRLDMGRVDAEVPAEHAARIANATHAVQRIADRKRVQHGPAIAQRMPAARRQDACDVAFCDRRTDDIDLGRE